MTKFKIAQITDLHLTPDGKKLAHHQKVGPYEKLKDIFKDIGLMTEKPNMIVITGDLIHEGQTADYQKLAKIFSHYIDLLNIPINVVLGNHDNTQAFFDGYLQQPVREKYYYRIENKVCDLYFLDSKLQHFEPGYLGQRQLNWLRDNLLDSHEKPALIFLHHPIDGPSIRQMRYSILQEGTELLDIIEDKNILAVLSGHIHFSTSFVNQQILFHSADSASYHINCDNEKKHLVYDSTNYDIVTVEDGKIGIENRNLFSGQEIIDHIDIESTEFVNNDIFRK